MSTLEPLLREHPFLLGLEPGHLAELARHATEGDFEAGDLLLEEGGEAQETFLIYAGAVALEIHVPGRGTIQFQTLGPGDCLGWSWLFPPYRWHFDARAIEPTRVVALDGKGLRERCEENRELGYDVAKRFLAVVLQRLERIRMQLLDVYGHA